MNWRGRPLTSHRAIIDLIGPTTTRTAPTVHAEFDNNSYPTGITISDTEMNALPLTLNRTGFDGDPALTRLVIPGHDEGIDQRYYELYALSGRPCRLHKTSGTPTRQCFPVVHAASRS